MGAPRITRRAALAGAAAGALAPLAMSAPFWVESKPINPNRKRVLRFAHITDIHVQPENKAPQGMEKTIEHLQAQKDKPEFVMTGGDLIMDAFGADADRTEKQWAVWKDVLKANLELPVAHCVGNHDVWGWNQQASKATGEEPLFGKRWALDVLELEKPYYSFDKAGWHWVVLDSTDRRGNGYVARLDDEQFEWLGSDLAANTEKPIIVVTHEPIMAICSFFDGENEKDDHWQIPGSWVHIDSRRIKDLFRKHPNVKLAISGHMHLVDRVEYLDVNYVCNGAVCGAWWFGNYHEFAPGYAVINLFDDGTFQREYVLWGWEPSA